MLTESSTGDGTTDLLLIRWAHNSNVKFQLQHEQAFKCNGMFLPLKGFLTESGRKRASVILSTEDQSNFQITQMKIKVRLCVASPFH